MKTAFKIVVSLVCLLAVYWICVKPSYQGRRGLRVSENFANLENGESRPLKMYQFIEVSKEELEAVGIPTVVEYCAGDKAVVVDDAKGVLYLRLDKYLENRAVIESMRPTPWW